MKRAQLLGVAIAGVCGLGAFFGVMSLVNKPRQGRPGRGHDQHHSGPGGQDRHRPRPDHDRGELPLAGLAAERVSPSYVQRSARPNAIKDLVGAVARSPMLPGEPVTALKLVKAGDGGVLAAILPAGMRAISTRIKEETGVGRLILPNDHVDVILTQRAARPLAAARSSSPTRCSATCACSPSVS